MPRARGIRLTPWITRRGPANVELPDVRHDCYNLMSSFEGSGGFERCPVRTIESRCKSAHIVALCGDRCRAVARISLATAFARIEPVGSFGSELDGLVAEEGLETTARLIVELAAAELSASHVSNRSYWGSFVREQRPGA